MAHTNRSIWQRPRNKKTEKALETKRAADQKAAHEDKAELPIEVQDELERAFLRGEFYPDPTIL